MSKYLLSLDQTEFLVKTPLIETVLDGVNSTYSANITKRVIHLGFIDFQIGLQKIPLSACNIAEAYIRDTPLFDFSILKEDDFHDENTTFSFIAPKTNQQNVIIQPVPAFPFTIVNDGINGNQRTITIKNQNDFTDLTIIDLVLANGLVMRFLDTRENYAASTYEQRLDGYFYQTFLIPEHLITGDPLRLRDTNNGSSLSDFYTPLKPVLISNEVGTFQSFVNGQMTINLNPQILLRPNFLSTINIGFSFDDGATYINGYEAIQSYPTFPYGMYGNYYSLIDKNGEFQTIYFTV
jgi:hypothetical protein